MHELALAQCVVDIAARHAAGRRVVRVELRVGHLRQVVPSALAFAFELLAAETPLAGAELTIHEVAPAGRCRACDAEGRLEAFPLRCARCDSPDVELREGEELAVEALELDVAEASNEEVLA